MNFFPHYTTQAAEDLQRIEKMTAQRILDKVDFYCRQNNPLYYAKKLTNFSGGQYRFRIGDYRVIFDLAEKGRIIILVILVVRHRREAYN
ncbi:MAG: type II toxin-antitoxin system RelE/ParE family toxin [Candidatus Magasanikbacteria bacterium]|nr:type II toxin-antitoxin system RelE/ParE family toxin [Candidatus Magasanikbacteria bacterium]